jgi:two-component system cell cycle sensor histidine kinase/response regulator CckA
VHGIAKQHQGWIELKSGAGLGSTFRMFLPLLPQTTQIEQPSVTGEIQGGTKPFCWWRMSRPCETSLSGPCSAADNGYEALRQWETCNGQIDLLFSDVIMPGGMTGLELAARLKQVKADLKVIISSGYSPDLAGKDRTFFQRNKSCFLQKPYAPRVLLETVRRCLDEGTSVSGSL